MFEIKPRDRVCFTTLFAGSMSLPEVGESPHVREVGRIASFSKYSYMYINS